MKKPRITIRKTISFVTGLLLVLQSLVPNIYYSKTFAQEETTSETAIVVTPTEEITPTIEPTPTVEPTIIETPSPTEETTPTPEPTITSPAPTEVPQPTETGPPTTQTSTAATTPTQTTLSSPTPSITPEQTEIGDIQATILNNLAAPTFHLDGVNPDGSANLTTDKADYSPTDTAIITGSDLTAGKSYIITISSNDPPTVTVQITITADDKGTFIYAYQLDGNYRANYKVELTNASNQLVASTNFTDTVAKPTTPNMQSPIVNSTTSITLNWIDKSADEDDFHLERKFSGQPESTYSEIAVILSTDKSGTTAIISYTNTGLSCYTDYVYRIRAHRHVDNIYSSYSGTTSPTTLYLSTVDVTDLTPDTTLPGTTNVPMLSFTLNSCLSTAKIMSANIHYTGTNKNDLTNIKLWKESGTVPGSFDAGTDTLLGTDASGDESAKYSIGFTDILIGISTMQFYVSTDVKSSASIGDTLNTKILQGQINITDNPDHAGGNPGENNWPLGDELATWDPAGSSLISDPNQTPSFDPIADQVINENSPSQDVIITNTSPGSGESGQTVAMSATSSDPTIIPNPSISGSGATRTLTYTPAPNQYGSVTITVTADDEQSSNNTYARTFTITVNQDTTPPVITVLGDNPITIEINSSYFDAGATAIDDVNGDVSFNLTYNGSNVDTSHVGSYTVYFDVNDSNGNSATQATRTVNVIDSIANAFAIISANLSAPGSDIANNLNLVNTNNVTNFSNLYFEKSISGTSVGKLTFTAGLDLSDGATQTFLQNLGTKLDQANGRIAFEVSTSAIFSATGATLTMYDMPPGILESQLVVRDDLGNILDPVGIVGAFSQIGTTVSFSASHFTQFDIDTTPPTIDPVSNINEEATSASGAEATFTEPMSHDNIDGDIISTCNEVSGSTFTLGTTTVTCSKTDTAGNTGSGTFTITVEDTTPPTITLLDDPQTVELGSTYTDPKATFYDAVDGTFLIRGNSKNKVNTNIVGTYTFNYTAGDDAGNEATPVTRTVTVVDTTPPQLNSAETQDTNGDGNIDAIKLTFNKNIDDSKLAAGSADGWDVTDPAGSESIGTGDIANDNVLLLSFGQGPTPDSGNAPTVTYTATGGTESTHDTAGNELASLSAATTDGALPVILSAETQDINGNGKIDGIKLTFSEDIKDSSLSKGNSDGWDVVGYGGEAIDTGSIDNDNILLLTITEGPSYDVDTTPTIKYTNSNDLASAHDMANNELATHVGTTTDKAAPTKPVANPVGGDYLADQSVTLTAESNSEIRYTTDEATPSAIVGEIYSAPILIGTETTLKAIVIDTSENISDVMTETYGIAPKISAETTSSTTTDSVTVTWTTDDPATSRVVYDTISHPELGAAPNYGYPNSTVEADNDPKVTSHSVTLTGLTAGTTYYYRVISHGSPESVSEEKTLITISSSSSSGGGGGPGDGLSDGRSDGRSDGMSSAPLANVLRTYSFVYPQPAKNILGVQTQVDITASPSATPTPGVVLTTQKSTNFLWFFFEKVLQLLRSIFKF